MPLRHRCGYAAVFPRSLPGGSCVPPREFPARHEGMSTAFGKSGWAVLVSLGWRPPVFQAGGRVFSRRAGLGGQGDHPLACQGLGEPV
jgi:hypothetical protein